MPSWRLAVVFAGKTALVDASSGRRLTYAEYGETVEQLATRTGRRRFAGLEKFVAVCLPNSWEFAVTYHAATLAGGFPTPMNPMYREREIRFQLENSSATFFITDAPMIQGINLGGLPALRRVFTTRTGTQGADDFLPICLNLQPQLSPHQRRLRTSLWRRFPTPAEPPDCPRVSCFRTSIYWQMWSRCWRQTPEGLLRRCDVLFSAALPYLRIERGLEHNFDCGWNSRADAALQCATDRRAGAERRIYNWSCGSTCAECFSPGRRKGRVPGDHRIHWVKSGAAPLPPDVARRFTAATGIIVNQGYGMTEASPVTHLGFLTPERNRPESIGHPLALTECRVMGDDGIEAAENTPGELVMRGPQFMLGYWKEPQATASVLRDGWYWSGDVVRRDADGYYHVLDRRKEMIKYKGFPVAPAEVEAVLMEHPGVRDCGVIARPN